MTPAIFLDKDGTVLVDVPYNVIPARMRFAPGALAGLERLATLGWPLIVISNQPGIALEKFAVQDLITVEQHLETMFSRAGAVLTGFYYCPHHPKGTQAGYAMECNCRKPAPGLLHAAAARHHIDLSASWFIGDILNDVEAGNRAGCKTLLLDNGNETEWLQSRWRIPDHTEADLDSASRWIKEACLSGVSL